MENLHGIQLLLNAASQLEEEAVQPNETSIKFWEASFRNVIASTPRRDNPFGAFHENTHEVPVVRTMDELLLQPDLTMNETGMLVRTVDERLFRRNLFDSIENVSSCVNTGGPRLPVGGSPPSLLRNAAGNSNRSPTFLFLTTIWTQMYKKTADSS
ncbi:hypothetical protein pipiens_013506 [Culex pipiens pipiens]|uniref:Uncharacterized protein n=1 Tax=Culex pipiens pipiens TaxID=38569 RepID=A0ABD1CYN2_CULPP